MADLSIFCLVGVGDRLLCDCQKAFREGGSGNSRGTPPNAQHRTQDRPIDCIENVAALVAKIEFLVAMNSFEHTAVNQKSNDLNDIPPLVVLFEVEVNPRIGE